MNDLFKLNMPFFEKEGGAAGGITATEVPKEKTDDSAGGKDAKKAGGDDKPAGSERTFSQEDVDRIVKERLEREHKKQEEAAAKAREDAEKKALEEQGKHKELAEKATREAEQARSLKEAAENALRNERIKYAVLTKAMQMNLAEPEDALKLMDLSDLKFQEDGSPSGDAIGKKLEELIKSKPYLVKTEEKPSYGTPKKPVKTTNQTKDAEKTNLPVPKF